MNHKELRKAIQKTLRENYEDLGDWTDFDSEETMGDAQKDAMKDIKASGEKFEPLGKSKFEKNLNINDMLNDLTAQKHIMKGSSGKKSGNTLQKIQKQVDHLKRFGGGSLNEWYYFATPEGKNDYIKDLESKKTGAKAEELTQIEKELKRLKSVKTENSDINQDSKINRVKDSEGNPIKIKSRVIDLTTGSAGHVERFGIDDKGKMTVHVSWISNFEKEIPKSIVYPDKITVKDSSKKVTDEGIGTSLLMKKGMNIKEDYTKNEILTSINRAYLYKTQVMELKYPAKFLDKTIKRYTEEDYKNDLKKLKNFDINLLWKKSFWGIGVSSSITALATGPYTKLKKLIEENIDEDSLEFRHIAGQREKSRKGVPLGKHAPHSQATLKDEGAGIGLAIKKGMNVKPTQK